MTACVKCGYERQPEDAAPEGECPRCGVIYAKAVVRPAAPVRSYQPPDEMGSCVDCGGLISGRALWCPHCGRLMASAPSMSVVVADVDISFSQMVFLMVKAVLAAIPAMLILVAVVVAVVVFVQAVVR